MIIVTGAAGQLGTDVVLELRNMNMPHKGIDIDELDITDSNAVDVFFADIKKYADSIADTYNANELCVIHCAAHTAVDKAEDEPELCFKINAEGTENIARACKKTDAKMIYISTDYVFDGSGDTPYQTNSPTGPISVYGKSKLAGEEAVKKHLEKYFIVRISWVFGRHGRNFVKTMLELSEKQDELNIVGDQTGSPTYTRDLAGLLYYMALSRRYGTYHATNEGFCTWAEFADAIMQRKYDTLQMKNTTNENIKRVKVNPVATGTYPTKAKRPKNSRLSKDSLDRAGFKRLPPWTDALRRYIWELYL